MGIRLLGAAGSIPIQQYDYSSNNYSDNVDEIPGNRVNVRNAMTGFVQRATAEQF